MHPLIVTVALDEEHQAHFDELRRTLFPAGRTVIGAHVTLFHALPGEREADVLDAITSAARRPGFDVAVTTVVSLGRGVAYRLESAELAAAHVMLRREFAHVLTPQDAQPFRPHLTVQNKVTTEVARTTLDMLRAGFDPFAVPAIGLDLWRYVGGPWEPVARAAFRAP